MMMFGLALLAGVGWGLVISPLFGIVLSEVPARRVGAGSGVLATTQQIASSPGSNEFNTEASIPPEPEADSGNVTRFSV